MRSVFSVALVFVLLVNPLFAQDDAIKRRLREGLYARMSGEIVAPLSVIRELSYQNAKAQEFRDFHDIALQKSTYAQLLGAEAFIKKVQADVFTLRRQVIAETLQQVKPSPALVSLVSLTPDRSFTGLEQDLQRAAAVNIASLAAIQKRLKTVQVGAIQTVLANFDSAAKRTQAAAAAQKAAVQIQQLLSKRFIQQTDITELRRQGDAIIGTLNDDARNVLAPLSNKDAAIRAYYQNLSNISTGISQQITVVIPAAQLPKIDPKLSVDLLQSLGAMGNAHASLVHALHDGEKEGKGFADKLSEGVKKLSSQWDQIPQNLNKVDPQTQAFITGFKGLVGNLHGDQSMDVPALASTLSAVGVFPRGSAAAQASGAITELIARKGDYSNAATGLVTTLSVLNKAGINIPGIAQVAPLLSAANSIFKAAGPLTTIAGFASGLGAFSMIGGLGGLGGGDDAVNQALAQITARLDAIEHKLDEVLRDLKELDEKITKYHAEEMHALEGITFEVVRTNQLITMKMHGEVGVPCLRAADPTDPDQQNQLNLCMNGLYNAYAGTPPLREPPKALSFELNVQDYNKEKPLEQTALDRWRAELAFRDNLTTIVGNANCQGLVYPSTDLESLAEKYAEYAGRPQSANCPAILKSNLVEPGITAQYVNWEQDALAATSRLPRADALKWWQKSWTPLRVRWTQKELPLLNSAIAQQAGVSGDVLVPPLSKKLDDALGDDATLAALRKIWNVNGLLAENIARYWIWSHMKPASAASVPANGKWARSLYAFAWESGDESYWRAVTHLPANSTVKFAVVVRPAENGGGWIWTVQFRDLDPVPLPEPSEMNLLQLRWPSTLSDLVAARARVIETLTGGDYVQQTWKDSPAGARDLLEAFATAIPKERLIGK